MRGFRAATDRLWSLSLLCCVAALWPMAGSAQGQNPSNLPPIVTHDNVSPGGQLKDGVLTIRLEIREGAWHPNDDNGEYLPVYAFGEEGRALSIPGPLIRVPEGTQVRATITNRIDSPATINGLHQRPGDAKDTLQIAPGESREVKFVAGTPGTYFYWGTTGELNPKIERRSTCDTELNGAFIVDPAGAKADDHILIISEWYLGMIPRDLEHGFRSVPTINGKSWPHTTLLTYTQGDTAHWRVINASFPNHPMHLHGAYFRVDSKGDAERDDIYSADQQRSVVTELMPPGTTMALTWTPERAGNWIFHCHLAVHFDPNLANVVKMVMGNRAPAEDHDHAAMEKALVATNVGDAGSGMMPKNETAAEYEGARHMAGLVVGIRVLPAGSQESAEWKTARRVSMVIREHPSAMGGKNCIGVEFREGKQTVASDASLEVGPPLVLHRGEPTEIEVINQLKNATAIHWHGLEIESYYDGVPGWGGDNRQMTPSIPPGGSFVVRVTPPRAGTFIYHTHWHDVDQLTSGLYGPLIVLPAGEKYDPEIDKIFVASRHGPNLFHDPLMINGSMAPMPARLRAGVKYRVRLINITPNDNLLKLQLTSGGKPMRWRAIAKDGRELPSGQMTEREAAQVVSVGETYDFELQPSEGGELEMKASFRTLSVSQKIHVAAERAANQQ
jgi:FtsP/CotA-like multicopper oxidase with cupredoxin domain